MGALDLPCALLRFGLAAAKACWTELVGEPFEYESTTTLSADEAGSHGIEPRPLG